MLCVSLLKLSSPKSAETAREENTSSSAQGCWGQPVDANRFTTFNARTYLQPQLQKAVRSDRLLDDALGAGSAATGGPVADRCRAHLASAWAILQAQHHATLFFGFSSPSLSLKLFSIKKLSIYLFNLLCHILPIPPLDF